jgi:DNA-directed RNA polymerase subunit F
MRVLKEEGENKRITMKEAKDYLNKAKSGQEDLTQTKKVVDYIERQNWSEEKLDQFLNEKLTDNSWTKAQGLGTFTKTQIKMIRSEL